MHYFSSRPADLSFPSAFCRQRDGGQWRELRPGPVREELPFCLPTPGPKLRLGVLQGVPPLAQVSRRWVLGIVAVQRLWGWPRKGQHGVNSGSHLETLSFAERYFHIHGRPEKPSQVASSGTRALLQSWWGSQQQGAELWGPGLGGNPGAGPFT